MKTAISNPIQIEDTTDEPNILQKMEWGRIRKNAGLNLNTRSKLKQLLSVARFQRLMN